MRCAAAGGTTTSLPLGSGPRCVFREVRDLVGARFRYEYILRNWSFASIDPVVPEAPH